MSPAVARSLAGGGHDVVSCGEWEADPGNEFILALAARDKRVLITLDKDFGELAVLQGRPHSGIIRLQGYPTGLQATAILAVRSVHGKDIEEGAIATIRPGQLRIRLA